MKNNNLKLILLTAGFLILLSNCLAQSIDELLKAAAENNPELKALHLQYEAALEKAPQVSQLPNPQVGAGLPVRNPETRLGPQVLSISASQMFPWFGTLRAKENVIVTMAKGQYEKIAAIKLELFYLIKSAYYKLHILNEEQKLYRENIRIYKTLKNVALSKVESGKAIGSDVLRAQIIILELEQKVLMLENEKLKNYAQINAIIYPNSNETQLTRKISVNTSDLVDIALIDSNMIALAHQKIKNHHPLIAQMDWQIKASEEEQKLNKLLGMPSLGIGMDYSMVNERTDASPQHNGRDIWIPKVMISVPIYRKKYFAKNREEKNKQEALLFQKENLVTKMMRLLQNYKAEYDNALLKIELLELQIKTSKAAYEILLSEYSSKNKRFDELMQLQNKLLQYDLLLIKMSVKTYQVKAEIDRLIDF